LFLVYGAAGADDLSATIPALDATTLAPLTSDDFDEKGRAIDAIAASGDTRALSLLRALLDGLLFQRKEDDRFVFGAETDSGYDITDALTGEKLGSVGKRDVRKLGLNNALRSQLESALARLSLTNPDPAVRLAAVNNMLKEATPETAATMRAAIEKETDSDVAQAMRTVIAMVDLNGDDPVARLAAIEILRDSLSPDVKNRLNGLLEQTSDGKFVEGDEVLRDAATRAVAHIDMKLSMYGFAENVFFGLSLGSVLLLSAIGLAITFGVMGVINMAHGELMMLGAYTTYVVQLLMPNSIDASLFVAIPAAFIVAALVGIAIERGVIRYLYGRPLETLLATFGISLILQQAVRSIFSPLNRSVSTPSWMSGSWQINEIFSLTYNRLYIVLFALIVFATLLLLLKKTRLGLQVRAVSQNRDMARAMGVRSNWVDALTFGLGSGIAGVAGVALSQLTNVGPNLGQSYIIDSFMVVVFGGVGNLWGTFVGSMSLGVVNKFLEPWSGAVLAKILVLVFLILFIQKRPRGLFPQKGRAAEG
jgi:urea transport system permease protein